ncbi:MAG: arginase family protein, partial [Cyanobacteria bacterium]|nr:arginase family protein [Cyanobacteriota bacterium]
MLHEQVRELKSSMSQTLVNFKPNPTEGLSKKTDTVTLIYVPLHLGGPHRGVSMGPQAMRVAELTDGIRKLGLKIAEEVEIHVPQAVCWDDNPQARFIPEIAQVSLDVARAVEDAMSRDTIPITIGGDHSLSIGSIAGVSNYYRKLNKKFGL